MPAVRIVIVGTKPTDSDVVARSVDPGHYPGVIGQIAAYIEKARGKPVPKAARECVYQCILDLMGAAAAGIDDSGASAIRTAALKTRGKGNIPIWFTGKFSTVIGAAWANSAAASAIDIDDGVALARGHPGAAAITAGFAVYPDTPHATFEDLINAIFIGYEIGVTISAARLAYGNTGTWSAYAVVATAAALRGTSGAVLEHALAIAGESGPNQSFLSAFGTNPRPEGCHVKEGIPWSVVTGLEALEMAEAGLTGPRNVLDCPLHYSFPKDLSLGSELYICDTYFKRYACCRHFHAPIDAFLYLIEEYEIDVRTIEAVTVYAYSAVLRLPNRPDPASIADLQYSAPYCMALTAIRGPQSLLPLTKDVLGDEEVIALARKITLQIDPECEKGWERRQTLAHVAITFGNRTVTSGLTLPQDESSPMSWDDLEEKFKAVTRLVANDEQRDLTLSAIRDVKAGDITSLLAVLGETILGRA